jgi:hypothetical protein
MVRPRLLVGSHASVVEDLLARGATTGEIRAHLADCDDPVDVSRQTIRSFAARWRAEQAESERVAAVEAQAARVKAGCPDCGASPWPEAHRCAGHRQRPAAWSHGAVHPWVLHAGPDDLIRCPMCGERHPETVVLGHLGLGPRSWRLTDAEHEALDSVGAPRWSSEQPW